MESTQEGQEMAVYFDLKYIAQSSKADPSLPWGLRHPWLRTSWNTGGHLCLGGSVASGPLVLGAGLSYVIGSPQSLCPPWPLLNSSPAHPFPSNLLASSSLHHPPSKLHTRPGPPLLSQGKASRMGEATPNSEPWCLASQIFSLGGSLGTFVWV